MKRLVWVMALCLICVCARAENADITGYLDEDMLSIYTAREETLPVAAVYWFQGNGSATVSPVCDPEAVKAALDAVGELRVLEETDKRYSDWDSGVYFVLPDGSKAGVSFNGGNLMQGDRAYRVDSSCLDALYFPTAGDDCTLAQGPDRGVAELMCRYAAGETPEKAEISLGEDTHCVTDAQVIDDMMAALDDIRLYSGQDGGMAEDCRVDFLMADGTEYTVRMGGGYFLCDFPAPLGTWNYWMYDTEAEFLRLAGK